MKTIKHRIHHYVPQFLLRNFTAGKKPQIWTYDKSTGNRFRSHVKSVAAERGFYDFAFEGSEFSIEPSIAELEGKVSKIFKDICRKGSIGSLKDEDRILVAQFLALQFTRTRHWRTFGAAMIEAMRESLRSNGDDPSHIKQLRELSAEKEKILAIRHMFNSGKYASHFLSKTWVLLKATRRHPFYLGDHPIALNNTMEHGPYGNIGLAVQGIEIYFPISRNLVLGNRCPSISEELRNGYSKYQELSSTNPILAAATTQNRGALEMLMEGIETGISIPSEPENIIYQNSLQVRAAERFVFSCDGEFSLVEQMLSEHHELKKGPRVVVN